MRRLVVAVAAAAGLASAVPAAAQDCSNAVIVGLAGVTWSDVERVGPPELLALAEEGAVGSVSVRTNTSRTTYGAGFATLGAGARMDAPKSSGPAQPPEGGPRFEAAVRVEGVDAIRELAREAGYSTARPGALATALGERDVVAIGRSVLGMEPPAPVGTELPVLLAAMDETGVVDLAAVGAGMVEEDAAAPFGVATDLSAVEAALEAALEDPCATVFLDPGDLVRADALARLGDPRAPAARDAALLSAGRQVGAAAGRLGDEDLLLVVTVTSPRSEDETHLGVAIARGPGFDPGTRLESASTREPGLVTLPDVAPTVLEHAGIERPSSMLGRPWFARPASGDLVAEAVDLDEESVFSYGVQPGVATGFVVAQVAAYVGLLALFGLRRRGRAVPAGAVPATSLQVAALAVASFPLGSYLAMAGMTHELGTAGFVALLLAVDAAIVGLAFALLRSPLDRLLGVGAATLAVLVGDLVVGERLQLNAVFGNSPIVAGRFSGLGNLAFSILGASAVVTATAIVHRWERSARALAGAAAIFVLVVVVDGAPSLGSDVGGVLALVPGFAITWFLLAGRRVGLRAAAVAALGGVVVLGLFLALDLSRPEESRTHLARLVENVGDEGLQVFADTIERKVKTNVRIFGSTIWTYLVPPALLLLAVLLRKPPGRWQQLATAFPVVRSGLVGGLVLALLGFAVNDSGIVVPAMFLSYLVPMALVAYVALEPGEASP